MYICAYTHTQASLPEPNGHRYVSVYVIITGQK